MNDKTNSPTCVMCGVNTKTLIGLSKHLKKNHNLKYEEYILKIHYDNKKPFCKCGCSVETKFENGKYNSFVQGHWLKKNNIQTDEVA